MPATKSQIKIDPRYTKTYATEANLNAAIEKAGIADVRHLIVWTESGRVTAVFFGATELTMIPLHSGFMVVG